MQAPSFSPTPAPPASPLVLIALLIACALPPLLAYNLTPSATLFNQLAALTTWGAVLVVAASAGPRLRGGPAVWALVLLVAAPLLSWSWAGLPASIALSNSGMLAAALLLLLAGQGLDGAVRRVWFEALCWGLLVAGLLSLLVSVLQVFAPGLTDGQIIAHSGIPGRAVGNMRQPNHLASLLMWSCVAAAYLADQGRLRTVAGAAALPALLFGFVFAVVLSASRTGMLGVAILAAWGALDRKLGRRTRFALLATPLMLAFSWWAMSVWASNSGHPFGAESRLGEGAGSPARLAILANAWELLKRNPLTGVGWGEFNLAWSLTPFPGRPIAFFDHTHDLPMQLAVELGLPLSLLILGLLGFALWRAFRTSMAEQGADAVMRRSAVLLIVTIGLHSLLEYPLWYAYFLLPTAFVLGLAIGPAAQQSAALAMRSWLRGAGAVLMVAGAYAGWDYLSVVAIYAPPANPGPLAQRIEAGQRSLFFAPQADYAAATSLGADAASLAATQRTAHNLIDARLMIAWAKALHATGDDDRARYVVQRLKEFRNKAGDEWLAACELPLTAAELPFQCAPPSRDYDWREMR
ncbi:hypothetical protein BH11PSE10_BH11PSE10_18910 [soil metagenome]